MEEIYKIPEKELFELYINQNKAVQEVAEIFKCKKCVIYSKLKKYKIKKDKDLVNKQGAISRQKTFDKLYNGHPMKNRDIIQKTINTRYEKNDGKYFSDESIEQIKITKLKKYGDPNFNNREKAINTRYEKNDGKYFSDESLNSLIKLNKENTNRVPAIKQTLLQKTGGKYDWNWKIPEVHQKQQETFKKKYNGSPLSNENIRQKIENTSLEKYNRVNYNQQHISSTSYTILNNKDKFLEFITNKGLIESAKLLDVDPTTISNYCKKYDIDKSIMDLYKSYAQKELTEKIKSFYKGKIICNFREYNLEIDIYLPEKNIGIEYNGDFWHNSSDPKFKKDPKYHYNKSKFFEEKGIFIYHIYEYEWKTNQEQILNQIKNLLGINRKFHVNDCYVKEVSNIESKEFLINNHRQGNTITTHRIGLYTKKRVRGIEKDTLVALMTFTKSFRNLNYEYELTRFCNITGYSIIEGASTLFNYFIENYKPLSIISYSDIGTTTGKLYDILGFKYVEDVRGSYIWTNYNIVYNREQCMKKKLSKLLNKEVDLNKTEKQIMEENGFVQIFNAGRRKHIWITKNK